MHHRSLRITLKLLFREWNWKSLSRRKNVERLIWTDYGAYRKDNRVVQNVGKPNIKFKFEIGSYIGGRPTTTPTHFSISSTGSGDRVCWMATPKDELFVKQRRGKVWGDPLKLTAFFDDPTDPTDEELDFLEFLMPDVTTQLPLLLPGLYGVDAALKERFNGQLFAKML